MAQRLKRLPSMQETQVQSLGQEDPLEKEMATHSGILAWGIPWTEEPGPWGRKASDTTERLHFQVKKNLYPYSYVISLHLFLNLLCQSAQILRVK